jgi:hypothetical protein
MLVLREGRRMRYVGCASFWDPPPHDREGMRAAARRVGQALRAHLGYQGAFTLDGIMSARGFLPTEVNTRTGEGLSVLSNLDETLPVELWSQLLAAGHGGGVRAEALERVLLRVIDQRRIGWGRMKVEQPWQGDTTYPAVWDGQRYRLAAEGEVAHAVLWAHAMQPRGFLRFVFEPEHTPIGPSLAPRVIAGLAFRRAPEAEPSSSHASNEITAPPPPRSPLRRAPAIPPGCVRARETRTAALFVVTAGWTSPPPEDSRGAR